MELHHSNSIFRMREGFSCYFSKAFLEHFHVQDSTHVDVFIDTSESGERTHFFLRFNTEGKGSKLQFKRYKDCVNYSAQAHIGRLLKNFLPIGFTYSEHHFLCEPLEDGETLKCTLI